MSLAKEAAHYSHYHQQLESAKTPEEREKVYKSYADDVRADVHSRGARIAKGTIAGAGAGAFIGSYLGGNMPHAPFLAGLGGGATVGAAAGGVLGGLAGAVWNRKVPQSSQITPKETADSGKKPKKSFLPESKYWPMGSIMTLGHKDTTVADLANPHMTDSLRKEIMRHRVLIHSKPDKGSGNAWTAGGRILSTSGNIAAEDRPAIIAHELGHHSKRHISKSLLLGLGLPAATTAIGYHIGKRHSGQEGANWGGAIGLGAGLVLGNVVSPLVTSEVHERQADRFAARHTSPEDISRALSRVHSSAFDEAIRKRKQIIPKGPFQNKKSYEKSLEEFNTRIEGMRKAHFERPAGKAGRAWSRISHAIGGDHPPLWSRLDTVQHEKQKMEHEQRMLAHAGHKAEGRVLV